METALATPVPTTAVHERHMERQSLDPRLLERPEKLPRESEGWRLWKLRVTGWLGFIVMLYISLLTLADICDYIFL